MGRCGDCSNCSGCGGSPPASTPPRNVGGSTALSSRERLTTPGPWSGPIVHPTLGPDFNTSPNAVRIGEDTGGSDVTLHAIQTDRFGNAMYASLAPMGDWWQYVPGIGAPVYPARNP